MQRCRSHRPAGGLPSFPCAGTTNRPASRRDARAPLPFGGRANMLRGQCLTTPSTPSTPSTSATARRGQFYSLPQLEAGRHRPVSRLPVSIRIVLESVLRNGDGKKITENDVRTLANWTARRRAHRRDPVRRRAHRAAGLHRRAAARRSRGDALRRAARSASDPKIIEPLVPVDLVVDHSVQVDFSGPPDALQLNMEMEFKRNRSATSS